MSLARLAPDAEHDLRLPQLAPLARSTPPEAHTEARVEVCVNALLNHVDAGTSELTSIVEESEPAAQEDAAGFEGDRMVAGVEREAGGARATGVQDDFSDITEADPVEEDSRAERLKKNGARFLDRTTEPMWPDEAELKPPMPTVPNDEEGFSAYAQIPTYKMSYLRIDVKQAMTFFRRSLLEYIRIVFWLLKTTSIFGDFSVVFDGFKKWYSATFDYFDEAQWQDSDVDAAVFKTAGNFLSDTFNVDRANIKKILLRDETADALEPDDGELPNSSSHCRALQVLAGEVIRSAQILHNVIVELKDTSLANYAHLVVKLPECVKFLEFNRKFVKHPSTGDQFEVRSDATQGWRAVVEMFFKRADLLGECTNGLDYGSGLQTLVNDMIGLPNFVNSTPDVVVKPYFCSQNYLVLWARCTLLRYKKNDTEYKDLEAYLKQFNQSSEHLFKASKKNQDTETAKKRTEEYRKLSEYRDIKTKGIYWHEQNVKLKKNGQYTKFYIASSDDRRLKNGMMQEATPEERAEYHSMPGAKPNSEVYKWTDTARGKDKSGGNGWDRGGNTGGGGHGGNGRFGQTAYKTYGARNSGYGGNARGGANVRGGGAQGGTGSGTGADKRRYNPRGRGGGVVQQQYDPQAFYKDKTLHKDRKAEREAVETAHDNYHNQRVHMQNILENIIQNSPKDYALWRKTLDELTETIAGFRALYGDTAEMHMRRILSTPKKLIEDYKKVITKSTYLSEFGKDDPSLIEEIYDVHAQPDYSRTQDKNTHDSDTELDSQDVTSREEDKSAHDSETDGSIDDGDKDIATGLSFNEADLTIPFTKPYKDQVAGWAMTASYIVFEPLASEQVVNVQDLIKLLKFMLIHTTPTEIQVDNIQRTWNGVMDNYKTIEQKFQDYYQKLLGFGNGLNVFERYVHFLLQNDIYFNKLDEYYQEWFNRAIIQQDRLTSERDGLMLPQKKARSKQAATTTPAQQVPAVTPPASKPLAITKPSPPQKPRAPPPQAQEDSSNGKPVQLYDRQGAAKNAKTNETQKTSVRELNRRRKEALTKEATVAKLTTVPQRPATRRNAADEAIDMAGLKSDMTADEEWEDRLITMVKRRESVIANLIECVTRVENLEILNKDTLQQEIQSYNLVKQRIRSMEADTTRLVVHVSKIDSLLKMLTIFTNFIQPEETQINENYAKFEKAKEQKMATINQRQQEQEKRNVKT